LALLFRRLHYGNLDFLFTVISIATYIADLVMDIIVAVYFYHLGRDSPNSDQDFMWISLPVSTTRFFSTYQNIFER
jgi:hypothetical protein